MPASLDVLIEQEGLLGDLLPGIFQRELPALLTARQSNRISLMITTLTGSRLLEAETHGNFYRPSRQDRAPEFTWRAQGVAETVIRQCRLDFLRHLGPSELNCRVHLRILDLEGTGGRNAGRPRGGQRESDRLAALPEIPVPQNGRALLISSRLSEGNPVTNAAPPPDSTRAVEPAPAPLPPSLQLPENRPIEETDFPARIVEIGHAPLPQGDSAPPETFEPYRPDFDDSPAAEPPSPVVVGYDDGPVDLFPSNQGGVPLPGNLYQDYFGFDRMPFNNTPDTHFFFPTQKHQEGLSRLIWAISERKGFVMISGEIGAGKSTLCRALLAQIPSTVKTALITHTHVDGKQLVRAIAEDLGVETQGQNEYEIMQRLTQYLIDQLAAGNTVCIILDEAQNLSPQALEEVRMISNIETEQEKLIQLILLGQPELREKLRLPEMTQLRQRIASAFHLEALNRDETVGYIRHRLQLASPSRPLNFRKSAMVEVDRYSGGIPRLINTLCDNALLTAFSRDQRCITPALIREAASDLELEAKRAGVAEFFKLW